MDVTGVTVDCIIKKITEFFRRDVVMPSEKELPSVKLFGTFKKFSDCETWLAAQYSVEQFSTLGHGNFSTFLLQHASLLPNELYSFLEPSGPTRVDASMLELQLEILLSQAESNLFDQGDLSKSDISMMLKKQFPTVSFHLGGDRPEECFRDLINRQKDQKKTSCILYSISLLGKHSMGNLVASQEKHPSHGIGLETATSSQIHSHCDVSSKDAIDCLLKVPMLSDLLSWSHWDALYAPSLGPLSDWLLDQVDTKELLCIATVDGKFIRIDPSATTGDFWEAMVQCSPFQVALKLLSILPLYGGVNNAPLSLLKRYAQDAVDVILRNSLDSADPMSNGKSMIHDNTLERLAIRDQVPNIDNHSVDFQSSIESISLSRVASEGLCGIDTAVQKISRIILDCLQHLPLEFRSFGSDILVSGLRSVATDAHSVILRECSQTSQRLMLHDIGLSLGIAEWIDDFHDFTSTATDLFITTTTLCRTSRPSRSAGTSVHTKNSYKVPSSNNQSMLPSIVTDSSDAGVNHLHDQGNMGESDAILACGHESKQNFSDAVSENIDAKNRVVQDAISVVEFIRREEFGLDPNLNSSDSCMLKKQHARLGRALHCLSQELYSQDSHLLLELVSIYYFSTNAMHMRYGSLPSYVVGSFVESVIIQPIFLC